MKLAIASDHAGYNLKETLKAYLLSLGHDAIDFGATSEASVDYPEFAKKVASSVSTGKMAMGVLVCGSGIGMCMAANRFKGVRAAVLHDEFDAEMSRKHNDCNVACFGARKMIEDHAKKLLKIWLITPFEGGRHDARVKKID